jgi:hypothetical protein
MNRRASITARGLLILLAALLVVGFAEVLEKRYASGGTYPHYASFRSDPLGTSALLETLQGIAGLQVKQNTTNLQRISGLSERSGILLLGFPRDDLEDLRAPDDSPVIKAVMEGARLVLTINPGLVPEQYRRRASDEEEDWLDRRRQLKEKREESARKGDEDKAESADAEPSSEEAEKKVDNKTEEKKLKKEAADKNAEEKELEEEMTESLGPPLVTKLGFSVIVPDQFARPEEGWETKPGDGATDEGATFGEGSTQPAWFSQFRFASLHPDWRTILDVDGEPVVVERALGKGSVVLASDSYFVSNEALHAGAAPPFLVWMLGGKTEITFDETIHGSTESGGAMKLLRRYRLHGFFWGLLVVVGLWAWRSGSTLAPGSEELERGLVGAGGRVAGQEQGSGLIGLLRRSIPRDALLDQCLEASLHGQGSAWTETKKKQIAAAVHEHKQDPRRAGLVKVYQSITAILRRR